MIVLYKIINITFSTKNIKQILETTLFKNILTEQKIKYISANSYQILLLETNFKNKFSIGLD